MTKPKSGQELGSIGFYQVHLRATDYTGELVDQVTGAVTIPPTMTKQEFIAECDINNIVREHSQTGQFRHINARASEGVFADLPGDHEYQDSVHQVMRAQAAFDQLPARARDRFGNDPGRFLEFINDDANREEAMDLGLVNRPTDPAPPLKVEVVNAAPPVPPKDA